MNQQEQIALIRRLADEGKIPPAWEAKRIQLAEAGQLTEDDIAQMIEESSAQPKVGPMELAGRALARGTTTALGLPGMFGNAAQEIAQVGLHPFDGKPAVQLPGPHEVTRFAEQATGVPIQSPPDQPPGLLEKFLEVAPSGLAGGARQIAQKGTMEALSNLGGSAASVVGAEIGKDVAGGKGEIAGALAAPLTLGGIQTATRAFVRGGWLPWSEKRAVMLENIKNQDVNAGGATSIGSTAEGGMLKTLQSDLESVPGTHGVFKSWAESANKALVKRLQQLTGSDPSKVTATLEEQAGRTLVRGIERRVDLIQKESTRLFNNARAQIGDTSQLIEMNNLKKTLQDTLLDPALSADQKQLISAFVISGKSGIPSETAQKLLTEIQATTGVKVIPVSPVHEWALPDQFSRQVTKKGNTYEAVDNIRLQLGAQLDTPDLLAGDPNKALIRRLYGAAAKDLEEGAKQIGSPTAAEDLRLAKSYWKAQRNITDKVLDKVNAKSPEYEQLFNAVIAGDLKRTTKMRSILQYAEPAERELIAKAWIARVGRVPDAGGQLSSWDMNTFLNRWENSSQVGRKMLLPEGSTLTHDMDKFVSTVKKYADLGGMAANPKSTGGKGLAAATIFFGLQRMAALGASIGFAADKMGGGTGVVGATGGTAAGIFGYAASTMAANGTARLLTNPKFVRWAADAAGSSPKRFPVYLARLTAIASNSDDPVFINDVDSFTAAVSAGTEAAETNTKLDIGSRMRYAQ